jgi:hypothetical protein
MNHHRLLTSLLGLFLGLVGLPTGGQTQEETTTNPSMEVCRAYFSAMDSSDLDKAESLFARESMIFESGGVEGSWHKYREHHLGPEIEAVKSFTTTLKEPTQVISEDGSMAMIAWPIEYDIVFKKRNPINSRGAVTFVLVLQDGEFKINHLHWSSRRK